MAELVEIILSLRGARQFVSQMDTSTKGVKKLGDTTEETGKRTKDTWKNLGKFAANSAMIYGATRFIKGSADATTDLAKSTLALQRSTGMEAGTASAWVSMLKTRGIETKSFNVGLVKLSKTMVKAGTDSKTYASTFGKLGIAQDTVRAGDVNSVLLQSADAFSKMTNPAEKAAMAQQLFGKQGQNLLPIMAAGSAGIQEQLGLAEKYGATVSGKTAEDTAALIKKQRELKFAQMGVQVQLGTALLPIMVEFAGVLTKVTQFLAPLIKNSTALRITIVLLTVAFVSLKVAQIAATIATLSFNAALLLIPLAVAAIVVGIVVLYKKWGWFHDAVNNTWSWIKTHWQTLVILLTGPIGAAVILIVRHFDAIRGAARGAIRGIVGAFSWLKTAADNAVHWVADRFRDLIAFLTKVPDAIKNALGGAFDFVTGIGSTVAGGVGNFASGLIPGKQEGGPITRTGAYMVGERGPEIVRLPRASEVVPNNAIGSAMAAAASQTIVTQVFLDRRQIAEAVGNYTSDRLARR